MTQHAFDCLGVHVLVSNFLFKVNNDEMTTAVASWERILSMREAVTICKSVQEIEGLITNMQKRNHLGI